jgi:hypothetical protein
VLRFCHLRSTSIRRSLGHKSYCTLTVCRRRRQPALPRISWAQHKLPLCIALSVSSSDCGSSHLFTNFLRSITMASPEEQAVVWKNDGNKAFAAHDWPTAIDCYTKAIALNNQEPTYYSNRAQVCLPVTNCSCSRD